MKEKLRIQSEKARTSTKLPHLLEWIPQVSPELKSPLHLSQAANLLNDFRKTPFEFVFSVPPRHGKSVLLMHFVSWAMLQEPTLRIAYVTYAQGQAEIVSGDAIRIARAAGVPLARETRKQWETPHGGQVFWTGIQGALTGRGFTIVLIDDPVRNRVEAESPLMRDRTFDAFTSDVYSRLQSGGRNGLVQPSVAIIQTRWHDDDLAGRMTKGDAEEEREPWLTINQPAILDEGSDNERALWEEVRPLRMMRKLRSTVDSYTWASLYQGHPVPRGQSVFGDPHFFSEVPKNYRAALGIDLAYTSKKTGDYSVIVTILREAGVSKFYVVRVRRGQKKAPEFKKDIRIAMADHPRSPLRWYAAGTEKGAADFIIFPPDPVPLQVCDPIGDKFTRAIPFAAAWNSGKIMVPAPELVEAHPEKFGWVNEYLDEMKSFTGNKDKHDDQVDASVAAFDILNEGSSDGYKSLQDLGMGKMGRRM